MQVAEKPSSAALPLSFVIAVYDKYTSFLRISGALHLTLFEQPGKAYFSAAAQVFTFTGVNAF